MIKERRFVSDYTTTQTLRFPEPPLHRAKFQAFALREIRLWEEIYSDFLATIPNLLVLHFEVIFHASNSSLARLGDLIFPMVLWVL